MLDLLFVLGVGALAITIIVCLWATRPKIEIVPEEERLVIYRFGKFSRIAGPGPVWIQRSVDRIERRLKVRNEPHFLKFNGLYAYDIPLGYTLSLWYRLDPQAAANGDKQMLRQLAQFESEEAEENIRIRIHDLFIRHIAEFLERHTLPNKPTVLDKLIPFCPGQPACDEILNKIRRELPEVLRSFGAVWNPNQPIAIKDFHLAPNIVQLLDRDRVMQNLLQRIPHGDPDLLTQATIAIEGIPTSSLSKIVVEQNRSESMASRSTPEWVDQLAIQAGLQAEERRAQSRPQPQAGHRNIPRQRLMPLTN